jgi:hypothetical protein
VLRATIKRRIMRVFEQMSRGVDLAAILVPANGHVDVPRHHAIRAMVFCAFEGRGEGFLSSFWR